MRLFIAVELPPSVLQPAEAVSVLLRERVNRAAPGARLTWVTPERMHVTLRFIGEVDAPGAAAIANAIQAPLDTPRFTANLGNVGVFPSRGAPRTFWIDLTPGDPFRALEQEVSARLDALGVPRETRPFTPHLTLARVREPHGLRGPAILTGLTAPPHGGGPVDAITLFESRLSSRGPTYTALQRTFLRQG